MTEQKHTPGPLHISSQNDSTPNLLLKPIPGQVVCEIDPVPEAEANARLLAASYNAFDSAASRLNLNAVELAEWMQDGGIADLVDALKVARSEIEAWRSGVNTRTGMNDHGQAKVGACFGGIPAISGVLRGIA